MLSWRSGYQRAWWRTDLLAGLTVTAILIPEGMAYAQLAGLGPQAAFYAAPIGLLLYAILGSSRQLVVAVSSGVAITSAATITALGPASAAEYAALTAALALFAGLISVIAGMAGLGRIAQFFSSSVLLGFVYGLAVIITVKQIPKLLGVEVDTEHVGRALVDIVQSIPDANTATVIVGIASLVGMVVLQRALPTVPSALVVLVGSIIASAVFELEGRGVEVVGELPSGLAAPQLPDVGWDAIPLLAGGAFGIALLAFAEAIGPAHQFARRHHYEVDANREMIAIGASNMGAGLFQGFPIGASLSKSAANDRAGAHSPASLVVAAAATAAIALFFTPLFRDLPEAALGAIVIVAVSEMMRIGPMRRLWHLRRADFMFAMVALIGVLVFDILAGLAIAVAVSLGAVVWRASEARLQVSGQTAGATDTLVTHDDVERGVEVPGLLIVRPEQMMFFVNASEIRDRVVSMATGYTPPLEVVVLHLALSPDLDIAATDGLADLHERLDHHGIELWLVAKLPDVRQQLRASGVEDLVGSDHVFVDTLGALVSYLDRHRSFDGRHAVLADLLAFVRERSEHAELDDSGRATLAAVEERISQDLLGDT